MKQTITLLHAADLHLGARLDLPPGAEHLSGAVDEAFAALVAAAVEHKVQGVLLCGDIFDAEERSVGAYATFRRGLKQLGEAGIPVFVLAGNHDPRDSWPKSWNLGDHVTFFSAEKLERAALTDGTGKPLAYISGRSYRARAERKKFDLKDIELEKDCWNICLLHSELESAGTYMPLRGGLNCPGLDYLALGHVHDRRILQAEGPAVAFPGAVQGKDMGETGAGGCFLVTLEENKAPQLCPLDLARVYYRQVDWEPEQVFETEEAILEALAEAAPGLLESALSGLPEGSQAVLRLMARVYCTFYGEDAHGEGRMAAELSALLEKEVSVPGVIFHSLRLNLRPRPLSEEELPMLTELREYFDARTAAALELLPKVFTPPQSPEDRDELKVELSAEDLADLMEAVRLETEDALRKEAAE